MPVSDHYNRYEKLAVRIITVDTSALRVEGVGKDAAVIQISVSHRPPGFRWPIEGELWIAERQGTDWALVSKMEDPDSLALSDGEPGDLMGPDGYIPQHEIKATSGQGLIWTTDGWVPENLATQTELDAHVALTDTAHIIPVVSTLPGAPVDGQVCRYQDAGMATAGLVWTFRYRTASASAYKWELVSGSPLSAEWMVDVTASMGNGAWGTFDVNDPQVTVPLAGDYRVHHTANMVPAAAIASCGIGVSVGGVLPISNVNGIFETTSAPGHNAVLTQQRGLTGVVAAAIIRQSYFQNGGVQNVLNRCRRLEVFPIRVG